MTQLSTEGTQRILHKVLTLSLQWKNFSPCTQDCPVSGYIMAYLFEGDGDYTRWSACSYRVYAHDVASASSPRDGLATGAGTDGRSGAGGRAPPGRVEVEALAGGREPQCDGGRAHVYPSPAPASCRSGAVHGCCSDGHELSVPPVVPPPRDPCHVISATSFQRHPLLSWLRGGEDVRLRRDAAATPRRHPCAAA
jgi:hypothetical protein